MAPTAANTGKPFQSSSSIIADTTTGYYILKIDGYSLTKGTPTGEYLKSHPFTDTDTAGVICVDDMEAQVFKALLYFAYTDSCPKTKKPEEEENNKEEEKEEDVMSQHLLVAADRYNLERLKLICEEKLCKYIDVGTIATLLTLAEQHHCEGLKKACFHFLNTPANLRTAMATDSFKHLSRSCPAIMEELIAMLVT